MQFGEKPQRMPGDQHFVRTARSRAPFGRPTSRSGITSACASNPVSQFVVPYHHIVRGASEPASLVSQARACPSSSEKGTRCRSSRERAQLRASQRAEPHLDHALQGARRSTHRSAPAARGHVARDTEAPVPRCFITSTPVHPRVPPQARIVRPGALSARPVQGMTSPLPPPPVSAVTSLLWAWPVACARTVAGERSSTSAV